MVIKICYPGEVYVNHITPGHKIRKIYHSSLHSSLLTRPPRLFASVDKVGKNEPVS